MSEHPDFDSYVRSLGTYYEDLLTEIRKDQGDAPCCHWGRYAWDWTRSAFAYVVSIVPELDDHDDLVRDLVGFVVNDSDGRLARTIISLRHNWPAGLAEWLDTDDFLDGNEPLMMVRDALQQVASAIFHTEAESVVGRLNPWAYTYPVLWDLIFDYWDEKED